MMPGSKGLRKNEWGVLVVKDKEGKESDDIPSMLQVSFRVLSFEFRPLTFTFELVRFVLFFWLLGPFGLLIFEPELEVNLSF